MDHILRVVSNPEYGVYYLDTRYAFVTYENQRWHCCTSRVPGVCSQTGITYPAGVLIYRPPENEANRSQRLLAQALDEFLVAGAVVEAVDTVRECDTCHTTLPLTTKHFAHPNNVIAVFRTTCRTCVNDEHRVRNRETYIKRKQAIEDYIKREQVGLGVSRVVRFPDNWKPNREGMRNTMMDRLGICSSLG